MWLGLEAGAAGTPPAAGESVGSLAGKSNPAVRQPTRRGLAIRQRALAICTTPQAAMSARMRRTTAPSSSMEPPFDTTLRTPSCAACVRTPSDT